MYRNRLVYWSQLVIKIVSGRIHHKKVETDILTNIVKSVR